MKRPAITVIGSINLDLVATCQSLPTAGETVLGDAFSKHPGGKGANQALAARRLGANVTMIGRVGQDTEATSALALLVADGVDVSECLALKNAQTGIAMIGVNKAGENQIIVAPCANAQFVPDDLLDGIDTAMIAQLEIPVETVAAAVERATSFVALNLAPAQSVPEAVLRRADLIIVNETEAAFYGRETLFACGGLLALTLGAKGAELYLDGQKIATQVGYDVSVTDTTGAGDTFVSALTVALVEQRPPAEALSFACAAGALCTTKAGAQSSLPWRTDVEDFLSKQL